MTCHTVDAAGATPQHIDATKAFQGGKLVTITGGTVQSSNLTPDATGIMGWTAADLTNGDQAGQEQDLQDHLRDAPRWRA